MSTISYWSTTASVPQFPSLTNDIQVDVAIIGAGLTGITAAYLLKKEGLKVALLERGRCAGADTGHTTAHLTYITDERLHQLVKNFGCDGAKAFWEAGEAAIDQIFAIAQTLPEDCEFRWVPGYLHGSLKKEHAADRASLEEDAKLANQLGFKADLLESVPYAQRPGVRFPNQAKFHPLKYLAQLVRTIPGDGSYVFENTEADEVESDPLAVNVGQRKIRCNYLMIATHTPLMGKNNLVSATLFQSKLALYTSYVLGATLPKDLLPPALFWDTSDPYYYVRVEQRPDHDYVIFGGEDAKTGQEEDPNDIFTRLEAHLKQFLPAAIVQNRWLGQVVETNDGLPFIGESAGQQFIATGFCGNGFTLGTLSAVMVRDRYLGRKNPWFDLFQVGRTKFHGGTWRYITENLDYPYYMLRDRLARAEGNSVDQLKFGEGKILSIDGRKVAAYRAPDGKVSLCSPVCTHLKCIVRWNDAASTWDCPCHGSRFHPTGEVLSGPAETALEKIEPGA
ncbi:MAG TPA: FAD-dependent oxidoreductase [Candidatus Saccharimonadales bacterium]|nr:FAD-dependent oxidoreductase [Candidatus Saccharimonadales bacterium]